MKRKNASALPWLRAIAFAALVLAGLSAMPFYPSGLLPVLSLGTGILALFAPATAVLAVIVVFSPPILAADLGVGLIFLVIGLSTSQYLGQDNARAFLIVGLAVVASLSGVGWAVVVIAGYAFGASKGAVVALLACLAIEGAGLVFGRETLGVIATGGSEPGLASFANVSPGTVTIADESYAVLGFRWIVPAFKETDVSTLVEGLSNARDLPLLVGQPILWALAGGLTGILTKRASDRRRRLMGFVSVGAGIAMLVVVSAVLMSSASGPVPPRSMTVAGLSSFGIAVVFVALSEFLFAPEPTEARLGAPSLHAEDADVDELLRVISNAEDELAARHTVTTTVLITDMKSFSEMTEESGSVATAKAIQRHRDLLLPIITRHHGSGKSTGGDGLLAAFARSADAVTAAVEMQRALDRFVRDHPDERRMSIRVGIALGEVVVDKHGRPFIGDALNRAARIMDLADGGQIYATEEVMDQTPSPPPTADHGHRHVKNIQNTLHVKEIFWTVGQEDGPPQGTGPSV